MAAPVYDARSINERAGTGHIFCLVERRDQPGAGELRNLSAGLSASPLRAATSARYVKPSLDLLEEIQRTGDIFFPESCLRSTLGSYQTPEVVSVVRSFLAERSVYNRRLKAKLLQAADGPFGAANLLYSGR